MEPQIDPILTFRDKLVFSFRPGFRKESRLRALHGQVHIPTVVVDPPDIAHSSRDRVIHDLIGIQDRVPFL